MIALLILVGRALALAFSGRHEVALENLALRQQLMTATRGTKRPRLDTSERFFWIVFEFPIVLRTPVVRQYSDGRANHRANEHVAAERHVRPAT